MVVLDKNKNLFYTSQRVITKHNKAICHQTNISVLFDNSMKGT